LVRDGVAAENDAGQETERSYLCCASFGRLPAGFYLDDSQRIELPVRMIAIGKTMEVRR
jgi:hypothetical protein